MTRFTQVKEHTRNGYRVRSHRRRIPGGKKTESAGAVILFAAVLVAFFTHGGPLSSLKNRPSVTNTDPSSPWAPVALPSLGSPDDGAPTWEGAWLRNYRMGGGDCADNAALWVVQPSSDPGMYRLSSGCFTGSWRAAIVAKCQSYGSALPPGTCGVWDRDGIMSAAEHRGDLLVVSLTSACLQRAGLTAFHAGPIHRDCVKRP